MNEYQAHELAEALIQLVAFAFNAASTNPNSYQNNGMSIDKFDDQRKKAIAKFVNAVIGVKKE